MKRARGRRWHAVGVRMTSPWTPSPTARRIGPYICDTIDLADIREVIPDVTIEVTSKLLRVKVP